MVTGIVSLGPLFHDDARPATPERPTVPFAVSLLALGNVPGLGTHGLRALADELGGDLPRLWQMSQPQIEGLLARVRVRGAERIARDITERFPILVSRAERQLDDLSRRGVEIIAPAELPSTLREIPDAPQWLFFQGDRQVLYHRPVVAVVGTRKPSPTGRRVAAFVAKMLAAYPIVLVSGLAEGIDEEAHRASLQEGVRNLAFLGHGIDVVFPSSTAWIRDHIVEEGGGVATEYLPREHYRASYFVQRNRLQAALADLVIPIETRQEGGTAHTIRFARRYRRRILALRWKGASGVVERLAGEDFRTIDIVSDPPGWKELDRILQALAEEHGHQTSSLSLVERRLRCDLMARNVRPGELERLMRILADFATSQGDA